MMNYYDRLINDYEFNEWKKQIEKLYKKVEQFEEEIKNEVKWLAVKPNLFMKEFNQAILDTHQYYEKSDQIEKAKEAWDLIMFDFREAQAAIKTTEAFSSFLWNEEYSENEVFPFDTGDCIKLIKELHKIIPALNKVANLNDEMEEEKEKNK